MTEAALGQFQVIAILGGTFNPIHLGHRRMACSALACYPNIDRLLVMPNHMPAYKETRDMVSDRDRLAMAELAFSDMEKVSVSDLEIRRGGYTYTVDTLRYLREINPMQKVYFIIGDDSLFSLHKWREYQEVLSLCTLLVAVRNEGKKAVLSYAADMMKNYPQADIQVLPMEEFFVSSSEIREKLSKGEDVSGLVCPAVYEYILENNLYRSFV